MVIYNFASEDPNTSSVGHLHWTTGILFDNYTDYGKRSSSGSGRVLGLYNRGSFGTNHGWSSADSVAWNCDLRRTSGPHGRIIIQKPPTAQNYALGCKGIVNGSEPFAGPLGFLEGTIQEGLDPPSLYEAQLSCRLSTTSIGAPEEGFAFTKINLYPNLSSGLFILESSVENITRFTVTDITGRLLLNGKPNANRFEFGQDLPPGVYMLSLFSIDKQAHFKLIKHE